MTTVTYLMVSKDEVSFIVKGKLYTVKNEGGTYYLMDEDNNKFEIKEYSIDCDSVILITDHEIPLRWNFCEVVED